MTSRGIDNWIRFHNQSVDPEAMLRNASNAMEETYYRHTGAQANKWHHYLAFYDRHFSRYRGKPVRVLELGIDFGGSLQLWKSYFGEQAMIYGIDIREECRAVAEDRVTPFIGSQADIPFLERMLGEVGELDIVIDDGSHVGSQQVATFKALYPRISHDGVYLLEDMCTNYWSKYQGGYRKPDTFIEYAKTLIDKMNAWYIEDENADVDETFARMTEGIFIYDSIIVFEKRRKQDPVRWRAGVRPQA